MISDDHPLQLVRGENLEPDSGWPWYLTTYEIEYVRAFNVRPPRAGSWVSTPDAEQRLEQEAEGVRRTRDQAGAPTKQSWSRKRVRFAWPWIVLACFSLVATAICTAFAISESVSANALDHKTSHIKEEMSGGN